MFCEKFQTAQKYGLHGSYRPCGPFGEWKVHSCSGDLRLVAFRDRIGAGRVENQRALAGNQRLVVRRVVVSINVAVERLSELLEEFERLPGRVGLDCDIAFGVDEIGAIAVKYRSCHIN